MVHRPPESKENGQHVGVAPARPLASDPHASDGAFDAPSDAGSHAPLHPESARDDIERVCQEYQRARGSLNPVSIEPLVQGWEEPERSKLLCELLVIELQWRQQAKMDLRLSEVRQQFSQDPDAVEEAIARVQNVNTLCPSVGVDRISISTELHRMRFLAEGGLGQVFIGEDQTLRREAAIKLIREDLVHDTSSCDQFRLEAEVTGRLDHPGIPVVYGIGKARDSRPFYVMKYVRGTGLDQLIRRHHKAAARQTRWGHVLERIAKQRSSQKLSAHKSSSGSAGGGSPESALAPTVRTDTRPLDLHELLSIFISVCHTVGYAHRRGILHRDIKPGNVIHGKYGETITIDWGLALPIARQGVFKDQAEQTLTPLSGRSSRGSVGCIGTPAFMSPEQATGNVPLTPASDIFSLGATLYCILTGRPPYQSNSVQEVRQKAIECDFPPIRDVAPAVPHALQAICAKAMRRDISARYKTTHELIADLHAYLSDQPVSAVQETPYTHLVRWTRHNTNLVLWLMLSAVMLLLGSTLWASYKSSALANQTRITDRERELRQDGLLMAADMAARTVAGKLDLAFRSLELAAHDDILVDALAAYNEAPGDESVAEIQSWLNDTVVERFKKMQYRAWFVMSQDGTTVARFPEFSDSSRAASIGKNFAFRDYFHGLGQDLPPGTLQVAPITKPHNASIVFSTHDAELTAYFSVPVFDATDRSIGVLTITVDRKTFFDLKAHQPDKQQLLLIETRGYPLLSVKMDPTKKQYVVGGRSEWSAGTVIHHEDENFQQTFDDLLRIPPPSLKRMLQTFKHRSDDDGPSTTTHAKLFEEHDEYRDPMDRDQQRGPVTAAYSPVIVDTREDASIADTGWFVIVQQHSGDLTFSP